MCYNIEKEIILISRCRHKKGRGTKGSNNRTKRIHGVEEEISFYRSTKRKKNWGEIEYKENRLRLDEKHCLEMKVLKLKEMKLLRDLGLESNEPWIMEPKTIQVPLSILTYLIPEEIPATNRLIFYWKINYIVYTEEF